MLIKINQAIKGAGSFTWHVLIPDEGDIRKHFYGSVKKRTSSGKSKKKEEGKLWLILLVEHFYLSSKITPNFCDGNIFDKICTATAKRLVPFSLLLIYLNGLSWYSLVEILHFFTAFFTWGMNSKRELLHKQCLLETF